MIAVTTAGPRFPLEQLMAVLAIDVLPDGCEGGQQAGQPAQGLAALAVVIGVSHRTAQRLLAVGLTELQADRYAVAAGLHPQSVWSSYRSWAPGEDELVVKRCRCAPRDRRPVGRICDRCGRSLPAPSVSADRRVA